MAKKKTVKKRAEVFVIYDARLLYRMTGTITTRSEFVADFKRVIPKGWFLTTHRGIPLQPAAYGPTRYRKSLKGVLTLYRKRFGKEYGKDVRDY